MRFLFELGSKSAKPDGTELVRPSARSIIIRDGKTAMVHSAKYDYYTFPGGGIEGDEDKRNTVIRETREEAGLAVIRESITEYGIVHCIFKGVRPGIDWFVQDNYYYLCDVEDTPVEQKLDGYEAEEGFTLEWVTPDRAISVNRYSSHGDHDQNIFERDARLIELLVEEGYFK